MTYGAAMSYPPRQNIDDDPAFVRRIMADYGFALLVVEGLHATQLPLLWRDEGPEGTLYGHLARNNPICDHLDGGAALAVFSGPHGYVSAQLYDDPTVHVPTWNYASVQLRGRLQSLPDEHVLPHLNDMTQAYEGPDGWAVADAKAYVAALQNGIRAFRLVVETCQPLRKMSAKAGPAMQKRIIDAARMRGEHAFADEMTRIMKKETP
ncbi:transcriptional regulator [Algimonas porphyrae]|uniref:Transcriptional regulator n=2 Tax=Algimonas porphyrae TaxID=1128113 RepID=A0ABQ5V1J1_9PROT|nr:transcriptional regulator [Algimonas porphyrae]